MKPDENNPFKEFIESLESINGLVGNDTPAQKNEVQTQIDEVIGRWFADNFPEGLPEDISPTDFDNLRDLMANVFKVSQGVRLGPPLSWFVRAMLTWMVQLSSNKVTAASLGFSIGFGLRHLIVLEDEDA